MTPLVWFCALALWLLAGFGLALLIRWWRRERHSFPTCFDPNCSTCSSWKRNR